VPFALLGELPGEHWLSATDDDALLFAVTGAGLLTADVLLPVPSSVVVTLLGTRLGFTVGWLSACAGLTLGNLLGYAVGHLWPRRFAPDLPERPTALALFLSRPVPIVAEAVTIAAGAGRAPLLHVAAASFAGNLVYTGLLCASGAALLEAELGALSLVGAFVLPVAGWWLWHRRARHNGPAARADAAVND
jgi:uncharacterized membrane protein YdjX (TVP38/TMEM64 family)